MSTRPDDRASVEGDPWTVFKAGAAAHPMQMVCFPYAGGHSTVFKSWAAALDPLVDVYGIQLPGRGRRHCEPYAVNLVELAASLAGALRPVLRKPFVLFGHSLGALLAFEVARALRCGANISPRHLFVSAKRPPQAPKNDSYRSDLTDEELVQKLSDLNGTPTDILMNRDLMKLVLPALRADFRLDETYEYVVGEPLTCPITVLAGLGDEDVRSAPLDGWRDHTTGDFSIVWFKGDHFYINSCEADLLRYLRGALHGLVVRLSGSSTRLTQR